MQIRRSLLFVLIAFTTIRNQAHAELPPLSKDELDKAANLIVTGTVTGVSASWPSFREHGLDYIYDLTIRVDHVEKGNLAEGATLIARGKYTNLRSGYRGSAGHYSDDMRYRLNAVTNGTLLKLHLHPLNDGLHPILSPNGFAVIGNPPPNFPWHLVFWISFMCIGIVGIILYRRRQRN